MTTRRMFATRLSESERAALAAIRHHLGGTTAEALRYAITTTAEAVTQAPRGTFIDLRPSLRVPKRPKLRVIR